MKAPSSRRKRSSRKQKGHQLGKYSSNGKNSQDWFKKTYGKMPLKLQDILNNIFDNDGPNQKTPEDAFHSIIKELEGKHGDSILSGGGGPYHKRTWAIWFIIVCGITVSLGTGAYFGVSATADYVNTTESWSTITEKVKGLADASGLRITEEVTAATAELMIIINGRGKNVPKLDAISLYSWIALTKSLIDDSKKMASSLWKMIRSGGTAMINANTALLDAIESTVVFKRNGDPNGANNADVKEKIDELIKIMQQQGNQSGISALQSLQSNSTAGPHAPSHQNHKKTRRSTQTNGPAAIPTPPSSPHSSKTPPGTPPPLSSPKSPKSAKGRGVVRRKSKKRRRRKKRESKYRRAQ